jgi:hypothetical protein
MSTPEKFRPVPPDAWRPKCETCNKPLKPDWHDTYKNGQLYPVDRWFTGYGKNGNNHFCTYTCGFDWAVALLNEEPPTEIRST